MGKLILKRLLYLIPVLIGATFIVYAIMFFAGGDPAREILGIDATPQQVEELREEMGLNDSLFVQYGRYIVNLCKGDMGTSYKTGKNVAAEIGSKLWNTVSLSLLSVLISVIIAIPLGIVAALKRNSLIDTLCMLFSMIGLSMPQFWLGLLLILFFGLRLGWFPISGAGSAEHIILPALTIALKPMASIARTTRSSMLDELSKDYLQTARSKGISERSVIIRHALKNSMIPTITMIGLQLGIVLAGSVVVETIFSWPGIGRLMIQAINSRDIPVVMGCIVLFVIFISLINLIVDILYGFVDPRMKLKI